MGLRCFHTSLFIETPSLEGLPTKAKEDSSPHEMRLSPAGNQPSISWSRGIIIIVIIIIIIIKYCYFVIMSLSLPLLLILSLLLLILLLLLFSLLSLLLYLLFFCYYVIFILFYFILFWYLVRRESIWLVFNPGKLRVEEVSWHSNVSL